jgi:hypothetical protein
MLYAVNDAFTSEGRVFEREKSELERNTIPMAS